jgi:DNA-nicking Smr family endonuclease
MAWIKTLIPGRKSAKPEKPAEPVKRRRRKGEISPEDHAIWAEVAKTAKPLPGRMALALPEAASAPVPQPSPQHPMAAALATPASPIRSMPPLAGVEKRMVREISRGQRGIDARIDLHGMRQAEAHAALGSFIHRAHASGAKLVLVITGKGGGLDGRGEERGVLRRMVPHWLADPVLRRLVIGFDSAARGHGGEGALYVRIRRRRETE